MTYSKVGWRNGQAPAINETNLEHMDSGIEENDLSITNILDVLGISTDTWVSGTSYTVGTIVVYHYKLYECISATSGTTAPSSDTTHWNEISILVN